MSSYIQCSFADGRKIFNNVNTHNKTLGFGSKKCKIKSSFLNLLHQHSTIVLTEIHRRIRRYTSLSSGADYRAATWISLRDATLALQSDPKVGLIIQDASAKIHNKILLISKRTFPAQITSQWVHMLFRHFSAVLTGKILDNSSSTALPEEAEAKWSQSSRHSGGCRGKMLR